MPPFIRRRSAGWDWFTPAAVRHLPLEQRDLLLSQTLNLVERHWYFRWKIPALSFVLTIGSMYGLEWVRGSKYILFFVLFMVFILGPFHSVYQRSIYRQTLRRLMLEARVRPGYCFDCGGFLEGYTGDECYICGAALIAPPADDPPAN